MESVVDKQGKKQLKNKYWQALSRKKNEAFW